MSDPLEQLLQRADSASTCAPPAADDLPQRVRRRFIRQRRATKLIASTTVALIVILSIGLVVDLHKPAERVTVRTEQARRLNTTPSPRPIDEVRTSIAELDLTAHLHERVADELLANQSAHRHRITLPAQDPTLAKLQQQRDRAALLLVFQADQYRKQNEPRQAIAAYQRTIELFPQSHWAVVARERLKKTQAGA